MKTIEGVWDLPMIGAERLYIEHQYQQLTGGPEVTLTNIDGAFVEGQDGVIWQLQESYDDNEFQDGSAAQLEKIKRLIAENNICKPDAEKVLEAHKRHREEYLNNRRKKEYSDDFYPAGGLPSDSVLVVRTSALLYLQQRLDENQSGKTPTSPKIEESNLHIIGALLQLIMDSKLFSSEEELRIELARQYKGYPGCSERTLAGRFAKAKKLLSE